MGNTITSDEYSCIGGEEWFKTRCSRNFIVSIISDIFTDSFAIDLPFRKNVPFDSNTTQNIRLSQAKREEYIEYINNMALKSMSGVLDKKSTQQYEKANLEELSLIVHSTSAFEELFIKRNAIIFCLHKILRTAQENNVSLRPAFSNASTYCVCGHVPHVEYCPMHDLTDDEKKFLFPPIHPGMHVIRGPDWQWGNQDGGQGRQGVVLTIKDWKGIPGQGVRVEWENEGTNVYRYGAENSYDVVIADKEEHEDYPQEGVKSPSETFWGRYIEIYIIGGLYKSGRMFASKISKSVLSDILPDYQDAAIHDPEREAYSIDILTEVLDIAKEDTELYLSLDKTKFSVFTASKHCIEARQCVLLPFHIYIFSQVQDDLDAERMDTYILMDYLVLFFNICISFVSKSILICKNNNENISNIMHALRESLLGQLLPFICTCIYMGNYSYEFMERISIYVEKMEEVWRELMKTCNIDDSRYQTHDDHIELNIYDKNFYSSAHSYLLDWYCSLYYLLVSASSKCIYTYYTPLTSYEMMSEECNTFVSGYVLSGGLIEEASKTPAYKQLKNIMDNDDNTTSLILSWLESNKPEPAWKQKMVKFDYIEIKLFFVLIHLNHLSTQLVNIIEELKKAEDVKSIPIPPQFVNFYTYVKLLREHLRTKKQELAANQDVLNVKRALSHAMTHNIITERRNSTQTESVSPRPSNLSSDPKLQSISEADTIVVSKPNDDLVKYDVDASQSDILNKMAEDDSSINDNASIKDDASKHERHSSVYKYISTLTMNTVPLTFSEYVDNYNEKLDLLFSLDQPLNIYTNQYKGIDKSASYVNNKKSFISFNRNDLSNASSGLSMNVTSDLTEIPKTLNELICRGVYSFLTTSVSYPAIIFKSILQSRQERSHQRCLVLHHIVENLKHLEHSSQACRLYLLGVQRALYDYDVWRINSNYNKSSLVLRQFIFDYMNDLEGAGTNSISQLIDSVSSFISYLKQLFSFSLKNLSWRLGSTVCWFLTSFYSPFLYFINISLGLPTFFQTQSQLLCDWYTNINKIEGNICVSAGVFWDSLNKKPVPFSSLPFLASSSCEKGNYVNINSDVSIGCFPPYILALANSLRISYDVLLIRQFQDHQVLIQQNIKQLSVKNWTLTDVKLLFSYDTNEFMEQNKQLFQHFVNYILRLNDIFTERCHRWKPFALSSYSPLQEHNHFTCIKKYDDKENILSSSINDFLISSCESLVSSYTSILHWIVKVYCSEIIDWSNIIPLLFTLLYDSPRIQKLSIFTLQYILPSINQPLSSSMISKDSLLYKYIQNNTEKDLSSPDFYPPLTKAELNKQDMDEYYIYFLLHFCSHSTCCPSALNTECPSCTLCCSFFPYLYRYFHPSKEVSIPHSFTFNNICNMNIHVNGYEASYCKLYTSEEVIYLLRLMLNQKRWRSTMIRVFDTILKVASEQIIHEKQNSAEHDINLASPLVDPPDDLDEDYNLGTHMNLDRIAWFSVTVAVIRVLGGSSYRMYNGCRVRIHEQNFSSSSVETLLPSLFLSQGNGSIIDYKYNSDEALVLFDMISSPRVIHTYHLDVIQKVQVDSSVYEEFPSLYSYIQTILLNIQLNTQFFECNMSYDDLKYFDTTMIKVTQNDFENLLLCIHLTSCLQTIFIKYPITIKQFSKEFVQYLFTISAKLIPTKSVYEKPILRYAFNHMMESLINTYHGSPMLAPKEDEDAAIAEGQSKTYNVSSVNTSSACGLDKEDPSASTDDTEDNLLLVYDEKRMNLIKQFNIVPAFTSQQVYKYLRVFQDDYNYTVNFLMEKNSTEGIVSDDKDYMKFLPLDAAQSDSCILNDMETGTSDDLTVLNKAVIQVNNVRANHINYSAMVPPFTTLKKYDDLTSMRSVITSVTSETGVSPYSPMTTGIISHSNKTTVTLSLLDSNSGINDEITCPLNEVSVHTTQFGFYYNSLSTIRSSTCHVGTCLYMAELRDLLLITMTLWNKLNIDYLTLFSVNTDTLVVFIKHFIIAYHLFYSCDAFVTSSSLCPFSAPLFLLKQIIINAIQSPTQHNSFFASLTKGVWTIKPEVHNTTISHKPIYLSSLHPYFKKCKYSERIIFKNAFSLRVIFDTRCNLPQDIATLTFYKEAKHHHVLARFTGPYSSFYSFAIRGNSLYYTFESQQDSRDHWGYGFYVQPYEGIYWGNEFELVTRKSYDWICSCFDFLLDIGYIYKYQEEEFFKTALNNMVLYLKTPSLPLKSIVVDLLIKMISSPSLYNVTQIPDISNMKKAILDFCSSFSTNQIIPSQLPQLLEFICVCDLSKNLKMLQMPVTPETPLPAFTEEFHNISTELYDRLIAVHVLSYCLYYRSLIPEDYIHIIANSLKMEWNEATFKELYTIMHKFTPEQDEMLVEMYIDKANQHKVSPLHSDEVHNIIMQNEDENSAYYKLQFISQKDLEIRIFLFVIYNIFLESVIHLISLHSSNDTTSNSPIKSIGSLVTANSSYIFPCVKEDVLEISIQQTVYSGKDSYPVIILDNKRVFTDLFRSQKKNGFQETDMNVLNSQCTYTQMYRAFKKININVLRAKLDSRDRLLAVKYQGEQGLDWGGLYRDALERCIEDVFSDKMDLFILCPNSYLDSEAHTDKYVPNSKYNGNTDVLSMYTFLGYIIGISLRTKHQMSLELPSIIWKYIVGEQPDIEDLKEIDDVFVSSLTMLKEYTGLESDEEDEENFEMIFELKFSLMDSAGNEVELIPGGSQIPVTTKNRMKFFSLALDYRLNEYKEPAEAIAQGVYSLVSSKALSLFTWSQLEKAVCGEEEVDIKLLKSHTVYSNWSEDDEKIGLFWKVMESLSSKDRSQFLRFVWGRSRLPRTPAWPRPFKISMKLSGDESLPVAHTCFFQLELPKYSTYEIMRERLLVAIHFGSGEFMLR